MGRMRSVRRPNPDRGGDDVDDRVDHLALPRYSPDLPQEDGLGPGSSCLARQGWLKKTTARRAGGVAHHDVDDGAAGPRAPRPHRLHRREHGRLVAGPQVRDVGLTGAVDVPARVRREQVEHGLDADSSSARTLPLTRVRAATPVVARAGRQSAAAATQSRTGTGTEAVPVVHLDATSGYSSDSHSSIRRVSAHAASPSMRVISSCVVQQPADQEARAHDRRCPPPATTPSREIPM